MKQFEFKGDYRRTFIYDLFKSWHKTLLEYEKVMFKDQGLPYYYIERTNIGLLSASALKIGAHPIEEYSASKGKGAKRYAGRADLWIRHKNGQTFDFEAKQKWISLNSKKVANTVRPVLLEAVKAARKLTDRSDFSIGIVFVIPYVTKSDKGEFVSFRDQIINYDSYGADFVAVHFCNEKIWRAAEFEKIFYPGIAIVGKYG